MCTKKSASLQWRNDSTDAQALLRLLDLAHFSHHALRWGEFAFMLLFELCVFLNSKSPENIKTY